MSAPLHGKTGAEATEDIRSALGFACRIALDYDVKRETLVGLLEFAYDQAEQIRDQHRERGRKKSS